MDHYLSQTYLFFLFHLIYISSLWKKKERQSIIHTGVIEQKFFATFIYFIYIKVTYTYLSRNPYMLRIKPVPTAPRFPSAGEYFGELYKKIRDFRSFVDQATPRFEPGKKGFAVLRLTARPCRQKIDDNITSFLVGGGLLNFFFFLLASWISFALTKRNNSPFY